MLMKIYQKLLSNFGKQNWWPSLTGSRFEICLGTILTQNTSWQNVEKAINNLIKANCLTAEKIIKMDKRKLEQLIRPSGYYKQKAKKLKNFCNFFINNSIKNFSRDELLKINGVGPETADSILLYACDKFYFPIDAYTKRIFSRLGVTETEDYEELREFFESRLPKNLEVYKEFHALIVKLGKTYCKKKPLCKDCPLIKNCNFYKQE